MTAPLTSRDDNRFDFLRLLAAWLVLFSHCYPLGGRPASEPLASTLGIETLGGIGVAIFFVLSGYLVAQSLERSRSLVDFARRRALRIYPALVVVCLLCVLVLGPLLTPLSQPEYWKHSQTWSYLRTASAWSIQYPLPAVFATNPAPHAVNGSLWSLPYELSCYAVLVGLSLLPFPMRYKVLGALVAISTLLLVRPPVPPAGPFDKFLGLDYFHCKLGLLFALGACYSAWRDKVSPFIWLGLPLTGLALLLPHGNVQFVLFEFGVGTVVLWLALRGRWLPRIPPRMGDWSYGAYLYAFPVQQTLAWFRLHETSFIGYIAASTVITLVLAALSWHLVEKQALRWK